MGNVIAFPAQGPELAVNIKPERSPEQLEAQGELSAFISQLPITGADFERLKALLIKHHTVAINDAHKQGFLEGAALFF